MTPSSSLKDEDIEAILAYVEEQNAVFWLFKEKNKSTVYPKKTAAHQKSFGL